MIFFIPSPKLCTHQVEFLVKPVFVPSLFSAHLCSSEARSYHPISSGLILTFWLSFAGNCHLAFCLEGLLWTQWNLPDQFSSPFPLYLWCSHEESSTFWPMSSCLSSSSRTHLSLFYCLHNFMPFRKPNTARFLGCLRWEYTFREGWEEKCMQCNVYWEVPQKCSLKLGWRKSILIPLLSIGKCNQ